jgi:hypothetical protein
MIRYCESFKYGVKVALNTVTLDLIHVSVPAEDGSNMPLVDQHFCAHSWSWWISTCVPNHAHHGPTLSH